MTRDEALRWLGDQRDAYAARGFSREAADHAAVLAALSAPDWRTVAEVVVRPQDRKVVLHGRPGAPTESSMMSMLDGRPLTIRIKHWCAPDDIAEVVVEGEPVAPAPVNTEPAIEVRGADTHLGYEVRDAPALACCPRCGTLLDAGDVLRDKHDPLIQPSGLTTTSAAAQWQAEQSRQMANVYPRVLDPEQAEAEAEVESLLRAPAPDDDAAVERVKTAIEMFFREWYSGAVLSPRVSEGLARAALAAARTP